MNTQTFARWQYEPAVDHAVDQGGKLRSPAETADGCPAAP